jgi:hypothetical protein
MARGLFFGGRRLAVPNPFNKRSGRFAAMAESVRQQILRGAVQALGREELSGRLNVPAALLDSWLLGMASMPDRKFTLLTDVLDQFARTQEQESPGE